jgi:hypothetical protein
MLSTLDMIVQEAARRRPWRRGEEPSTGGLDDTAKAAAVT